MQALRQLWTDYVHVTDESLVYAVRQFETAMLTALSKKGAEIIYRKAESLENKGFLNRYHTL